MIDPHIVYHKREAHPDLQVPDAHQDLYSKTTLGFWIYLMTDCILFATFFATYAVLKNSTFHGVTSKDIFSLNTAFIETMILLFSSLTCGFAMLSSIKGEKYKVLISLAITFCLGASFIAIEFQEFYELIHSGNSFTKSAFLSSFFALVGMHGLHVLSGLLWLVVVFFQILFKGITTISFRRLSIFSMFWHFLDLIWIFIFTFVYLMGVI